MRTAWQFWKDWSPLVLMPLGLGLMVAGIWRGLTEDNARASYLLLLGWIISENAERRMKAILDREGWPNGTD